MADPKADPKEFSYEIKIPKDRVAVLIGKKGSFKRELEELINAKITVDSKEGLVTVTGSDAVKLFTAKEVILAISRGFSPETALQLLKSDYCLEVINIMDFIKDKGHLDRVRGRIIGSQGKARRTIETLTETELSVYGKTVGVIGAPENVSVARKAVESLLGGSPHASVYRWLEKQRRSIKQREAEERVIGL